MADEQKIAEAPAEAPVATEVTAAETAPAAEPAVEAAPAEAAAAATEEPAKAAVEEAPKEEVKPVEEGHLEVKGSSFPQNFLYQKKFFWFGTEAVEPKALATYLKKEKVTEVAHRVTSWASETGKGILFYGESKTAPHGAILLADASEPTTEGHNKIHFTSKGHKHTFKAANLAERDNWVAQLKAKIAEAKELATTVTETETYKKTLESLKPAVPVKKEEPKPAEEAPKEETPKDEPAKEEDKKDEAPKEEDKKDDKGRSASRKRASLFGGLIGKKEAKPAEAAPVTETPAEAPVEAEAAPADAATPAEAAAPAETAEAKPAPIKRNSIFGNLGFGKKKVAEPAEATPAPVTESTEASEAAPVIPAVETTEPLSTEATEPAAVPAEATEAAPATNGEVKKEVKSEKRKSSLPALFGKKAAPSATSDEEVEKPRSPSAFSKLRATIKGKGKAEKPAEKAEDKAAEPEAEAAKEAEPAADAEAPKPAEAEAAAPATEETPAAPVVATPVVAATA